MTLDPGEACLAALEAGLIVRNAHPLNCETPLPALADGVPMPSGDITIRGVAWSGAAPIAKVEVGLGDAPWRAAALVGERRRHAWQWWEFHACLTKPGDITIRALATDVAGHSQPEQPPWNELGYANNAIHEVPLTVAAENFRPSSCPRPRLRG